MEHDVNVREPLLKVGEVAKMLAIRPASVYRLVEAGRLPVMRVGKLLRFDRRSIIDAVAEAGRHE